MCLLTALVGVNYIAICRHYPDGGGVYASVRHRSEILSIVGAFLLIADYIVTAAISALSAFQYLGVNHPEIFAAAAIVGKGALNYFGPKHTGGLAFLISVPTAIVVVILGIFCIPHLGQAIHNLKPLAGGFFGNWNGFVGIVLALSGVEAIANATSVMKLDPGSTDEHPSVSKTSTPRRQWSALLIRPKFRTSSRGTSEAGTTLNSYRSRTRPSPSGSLAAEGSSTGSSAGTSWRCPPSSRGKLSWKKLISRSNKNTRIAYYHAIGQFLDWCQRAGFRGLEDIEPITVAAYVEQHPGSPATIKQHMSAIRMLFSWLTEKGISRPESDQ
jgi:Phage integrase, N-terminal SAM-like domain/Amino acid permease